ncbi:MAG: glycoside hydrolase family 3 C-terminal domain-containing protein [Paludibacteraceae bacterium]|nr:glycoside hydrolase family 3 C-terminal domain-containing protein [Paludibacteraceae bacterium]
MKRLTFLLLFSIFHCPLSIVSAPVYLNPETPLEQRVEDALSRMTLNEKIAIIHAQSKFSSPGVARLGIPGLWCTDGPHGIRAEVKWDEWDQAGWTNDSCMAFPTLTCLAATWNTDMSLLYGRSIGEEALYRGKNVLLGPGVNIYRTPLNGRNFEYMGEDPCLSATMVVPYVQGVQQNGVATCVKHFALNNQEDGRHVVNVSLSDRALYEIYLPAFRAAVQQGHSWSIMGAYNRIWGQYACHNHRLLVDILRSEWGFDGAVISDWGGVSNTDEAIRNGLDLEFGSWTDGLTEGRSNSYDAYYLAMPYLEKILRGEVGTEELDNKVRNVLRLIFRTSMNPNKGFGALCSDEHAAAAREIAGEGIVLLKNAPAGKKKSAQPVLPLTLEHKSILVVGENAIKQMTVGGGSSSLKAKYEISPLQGIRERAARNNAEVRFVRGYVGDIGGEYNGVTTGQDLSDHRTPAELTAEAVAAAREADVVLFIGGLNKAEHQDSESADRLQYGLPYGQNQLIAELAKANSHLAVIILSGNAYAMPWLDNVPALVQAWFNGSETGHALADILFGDVNPSGHLPFTIMPALEDYPAHQYGPIAYPGINNEVEYKEDLFVGYRYADLYGQKKPLRYTTQGKEYTIVPPKRKPLFAFGHGLSYTTFALSQPTRNGNMVRVTVKNTGARPGKEVVQLYLAPLQSQVARPVKELKAFQKVALQPGEEKVLTFALTDDMFRYFDADAHQWVTDPAPCQIRIGTSSANTQIAK